jgi:hypothetical protein
MISNQMPRIRSRANLSFEEYTQALALTYLSSYNEEAIAPSVLTAFKRAFAMEDITMFPNFTEQYSGCAVADWPDERAPEIVVAIPGISGISGILALQQTFGYGTVLTHTGSVYQPFNLRAIHLYDRLKALPWIVNRLEHPRGTVTFTGHSLGAAMAYIMAAMAKIQYPHLDVRCIKFGAPRTANDRFRDAYNPRIKQASIYNDRDPIFNFPHVPTEAGWITPLGPTPRLFMRNFVHDLSILRWVAEERRFVGTYPSDWNLGHITASVRALQAHTFSNPWYDHTMKAYRLAWMNYCSANRDGLDYRFNFLEFNDENEWQNSFRPGMRQWESLDGFSVGGEYQTLPTSSLVAEIVNSPAPVPVPAPIIEATFTPKFRRDRDWGIPALPAATLLPRRRVRRVS